MLQKKRNEESLFAHRNTRLYPPPQLPIGKNPVGGITFRRLESISYFPAGGGGTFIPAYWDFYILAAVMCPSNVGFTIPRATPGLSPKKVTRPSGLHSNMARPPGFSLLLKLKISIILAKIEKLR